MGFVKLDRQRAELKKARKKRDEWIKRADELEQKLMEAENTCIHDLVHEAKVTPEQLSVLLRSAAKGVINPDLLKEIFGEAENLQEGESGPLPDVDLEEADDAAGDTDEEEEEEK